MEARGAIQRASRLKTRRSTDGLAQVYSVGPTPSFLNGSGEGKSVSGASGQRGSNDLASLRSPPHSRSSSAQGSYSTSATTFEDTDEKRAREGESSHESNERGHTDPGVNEKEGKGNVIVSVRVRPDAGGDKTSGKDWMVDSRQSLIAFGGREGGDYYYGMFYLFCSIRRQPTAATWLLRRFWILRILVDNF